MRLINSTSADAVKKVACIGSSSTLGKFGFDWIGALEKQPDNASFRFYNFGVNGDLAYNGLQRIKDVIDSSPDYVVVQFGVNDAMASGSKRALKSFRRRKNLPVDPSPDWYRENMLAIVRSLKMNTHAQIALCSLNPLGEAPNSKNPYQAEVNRLVVDYNRILRQIVIDEKITYLPIYDRIQELFPAPSGKILTDRPYQIFIAGFEHMVLRMGQDDISRRQGWSYHIDGVHLNSKGGKVFVDLVQDFIKSQ